MNTYRVTYWSMSDARVTKFIIAENAEEAVQTAKAQDECFCQLCAVDRMDMSDPVTREYVENARR